MSELTDEERSILGLLEKLTPEERAALLRKAAKDRVVPEALKGVPSHKLEGVADKLADYMVPFTIKPEERVELVVSGKSEEEIASIQDAMYKLGHVLQPLDPDARTRVLEEVRQKMLLEDPAKDTTDTALRHINNIIEEKKKQLEELKTEKRSLLDVEVLARGEPSYRTNIEELMHLMNRVPWPDWFGTDRHKAVVRGIHKDIPVDTMAGEALIEVAAHPYYEKMRANEQVKTLVLHEVVPMLAATLDWVREGCPVFSLTDDFFHALAVTDFGDMNEETEPFKMPFHAFMLTFPPNTLLNAQRAFVYRLAETVRLEKKGPQLEEGYVNAEIDVDWKTTRLTLVTMPPLLTSWNREWTKKEMLSAKGRMSKRHPLHTPEQDVQTLEMARRILANTLTYIEANKGLPGEKRKHGTAAAPVEREAHEPRFRVGRTVKLAPNIRRVLKEGREGVHWTLGHRFIVRGHWRNQAHGPKMLLRMRKWIEPYWKGPETLDDAFERKYSVE